MDGFDIAGCGGVEEGVVPWIGCDTEGVEGGRVSAIFGLENW